MKKVISALALGLGLSLSSQAFAANPTLTLVTPRGAQRGQALDIQLRGRRLQDAEAVVFYGRGLSFETMRSRKDRVAVARIRVAKDCPLGEHSLRLRTRSGLTELRTLWIGHLPSTAEKEPNNSPERAQEIKLGRTIQGLIRPEDIDVFKFQAKKGQRLTAELEGLRLASTMFDPAIAIIDSAGRVIKKSDDHPLVRQDCSLSLKLPADGPYFIQVREAAFRGNGASFYRLHIGHFMRARAFLPAGGAPGSKVRVQLYGDVAGVSSTVVTVPKFAPTGLCEFRIKDRHGLAPLPYQFRVSPLKNVLEKEPNNGGWTHKNAPAIPLALNGIIQREGDRDILPITAKKGQKVRIEAFARSLGSPIDIVFHVRDSKGKYLAGNDDRRNNPDGSLDYTFPATGQYNIFVFDHLRRGGEDFFYRVEIRSIPRALTVSIPRIGRYGQNGQCLPVPRGNRYVAVLAVQRQAFRDAVLLKAKGLLPGVKAICPEMPANVNRIPVIFEASGKQGLGHCLVDLRGRSKNPKLKVEGGTLQDSDLLYGQPNNALYWRRDEARVALAVTDEVPFKVEIVPPKVPMVKNGSMRLEVRAQKKKDYKQAILVRVAWNSPGVSASRSVRIKPGENSAFIPMNANSRAAIGHWPLVVEARARVGNGEVSTASQLSWLDIAEPMVSLSFKRSAGEQGSKTELYCKVKVNKAFEGKAKARLLGLPRGVTSKELSFDRTVKELVFPISIDKKARPGRIRNIFGQVIVPQSGQGIVHRTGQAELRVDRPLKKKKPKAVKKAPKKPKVRGLSRLEQLRRRNQANKPKAPEKEGPPASPKPKSPSQR